MPIARIEVRKSRPPEQVQAKRALYQAIIKRFGALGIAASDVVVALNEGPLDNWGIHGGQPASEVNLGFKVNV